MKFLLALYCNFFMLSFLLCQEGEILAKFEKSIINASEGQNIRSLYPLLQQKDISIDKILSIVDKHSKAHNANLQREIARLYGGLALESNTKKNKVLLVNRLISLCGDSLGYGCSEAASQLKLISSDFFNAKAKKLIENDINNDKYPNPKLILIAGMLDLKKLRLRLKELLLGKNENVKDVYRLALARMGDREWIEYFIQKHQNDQEILNFQLLDDLLYIRQPEVIPIFEKILFSEGALLSDAPGAGDPYASFGMYYLGLLLENFPIPTRRNERSWDEANFALARQWMLANKGKYKIRRDEF